MNYVVRCIAPVCIEDEAHHFDQRVMEVAMNKLGLDGAERGERTATLLQRKLRDGGRGLTPAVRTSPAAFLGSLATCHAEVAFVGYSDDTPLPSTSMLHGWIDDSMQRVRRAAPGDEYQADIRPLLPDTAGDFFHFCSNFEPSVTTKLQRTLNAKATTHLVQAAVKGMKEQFKRGEKREWAHHKTITAKGACSWKLVRPDSPWRRLADVEYAIAARLNVGLQPFAACTMAMLPEHCPMCSHRSTGAPVPLRDDPWHFLACVGMTKGELSRRHDAVADAVGRTAWMVGAHVKKEVEGLDVNSKQRPDLSICFPGRLTLSDVSVSHSLTVGRVAKSRNAASNWQSAKNAKYAGVALRVGAELLNVCVDSCGGMASSAHRLVHVIGDEGERWSLGTWSSGAIEQQLLGAIAVAVQRGNALTMLAGYTGSDRADRTRWESVMRGSVS